MSDRPDDRDNPLGLGSRGRESANTGSSADTSYDARDSDRYETGEPQKDFSDLAEFERDRHAPRSRPADPDVTSSDER